MTHQAEQAQLFATSTAIASPGHPPLWMGTARVLCAREPGPCCCRCVGDRLAGLQYGQAQALYRVQRRPWARSYAQALAAVERGEEQCEAGPCRHTLHRPAWLDAHRCTRQDQQRAGENAVAETEVQFIVHVFVVYFEKKVVNNEGRPLKTHICTRGKVSLQC